MMTKMRLIPQALCIDPFGSSEQEAKARSRIFLEGMLVIGSFSIKRVGTRLLFYQVRGGELLCLLDFMVNLKKREKTKQERERDPKKEQNDKNIMQLRARSANGFSSDQRK